MFIVMRVCSAGIRNRVGWRTIASTICLTPSTGAMENLAGSTRLHRTAALQAAYATPMHMRSFCWGLLGIYRLTGDNQVLKIVDETLSFLDEAVASPCGGYLDAIPRPDLIRRQNPHMHLFEGFIALFQATRNAKYLARGAEIFGVFSSRFFRPDHGWICEYLTEDLVPLPGQRGRICEPGHHYEWIWLLRQFERASGRSVASYCTALYDHADRYGWDKEGFIVDEVESTGAVLKGSRRSWPHTEALKANIVEGEAGRPGCDSKAAHCVSRLMDTYMGRPISGGWIDHVDESGQPIVAMMPASTLYHVFCGTAEAVRAASTKTNGLLRRRIRHIQCKSICRIKNQRRLVKSTSKSRDSNSSKGSA